MSNPNIDINVSGPVQASSTYKTKVLKCNHSFASQVTEANTKYVIKYNFDLGGESVTIPTNCVLEFDGGSISNGTIIFTGTIITGIAKIFSNISGTLLGDVDCSWFGLKADDVNYDNGVVINKVAQVSRNLYIPSGEYYFSTPIDISDKDNIVFRGILHYNGTIQDNVALTIRESEAFVFIQGILCDYESVDYSDATNTNITGIRFVNVNNSNISILSVENFNTGVSALGYGKGCCYNTFEIKKIRSFNYGFRLMQQDNELGARGWCNQNYIYGCRFQRYSSTVALPDTVYPIYLYGIKADYEEDSYDRINQIHIDDISAESFDEHPIIYLRNGSYIKIGQIRTEKTNYLLKPDGTCRYIQIEPTYGIVNILNKLDLSLNPRLHLINVTENNVVLVDNRKITETTVIEKNWVLRNGKLRDDVSNAGSYYTGMLYSKGEIHSICNVDCSKETAIIFFVSKVYVWDTSGEEPVRVIKDVSEIVDYDYTNYIPIANRNLSKNDTYKYYFVSSQNVSLIIPTDVAEYFIGLRTYDGTTQENSIIGSISTDNPIRLERYIPKYGTIRPTGIMSVTLGLGNKGFEFFDENLGKPIYWTGSDWVDNKGFTATSTKGTTRPTGTGGGGLLDATRDIGFEFFDTNVGVMKPIYASAIANDGTVTWVDATGEPV